MLFKWKRMARHLEKKGVRAPAEVVEIAKFGHEVESSSSGFSPLDIASDMAGGNELAPNSGNWIVRKTKLRITPADGDAFEVEQDIRYGDYGRYVPKAGEKLDVIYDPDDHGKVMVAPPTAEEEAIRTANALSKADIGFQVGGGGAKAGAKPVTKEDLEERTEDLNESMAGMNSMLDQAQQFMSGAQKPGESIRKKKDGK
jgi:hypothetical protein